MFRKKSTDKKTIEALKNASIDEYKIASILMNSKIWPELMKNAQKTNAAENYIFFEKVTTLINLLDNNKNSENNAAIKNAWKECWDDHLKEDTSGSIFSNEGAKSPVNISAESHALASNINEQLSKNDFSDLATIAKNIKTLTTQSSGSSRSIVSNIIHPDSKVSALTDLLGKAKSAEKSSTALLTASLQSKDGSKPRSASTPVPTTQKQEIPRERADSAPLTKAEKRSRRMGISATSKKELVDELMRREDSESSSRTTSTSSESDDSQPTPTTRLRR